MSTELVKADAYSRATLAERRDYVATIAQAGNLLPRALWDGNQPSPAKVLLLAETGSMLGLHPMAALQSIHIIEGKPTLSANLLAALVRRAGHKLRVTTSGDWKNGTFVARAVLIRSDDPDFEFVVEWTKERAERAKLLGKRGPWEQYPEAMSKARAITEVIREGAPDVTIVAAYTPEELDRDGRLAIAEDGSVMDQASPAVSASQEAVSAPVTPERDWIAEADAVSSVEALRDLWRAAGVDVLNRAYEGGTLSDYFKARADVLAADPVDDVVDAELVDDEPTSVPGEYAPAPEGAEPINEPEGEAG